MLPALNRDEDQSVLTNEIRSLRPKGYSRYGAGPLGGAGLSLSGETGIGHMTAVEPSALGGAGFIGNRKDDQEKRSAYVDIDELNALLGLSDQEDFEKKTGRPNI